MHLITERPAKLVVPVTGRKNKNKISSRRSTHQAPATLTHHQTEFRGPWQDVKDP